MKKWIAALCVLALFLAGCGSKEKSDDTNPKKGSPTQSTEAPAPSIELSENTAPDFVVYNDNADAVKLSDFFGKPIVLNFWASWCGPCKSEMPAFQQAYEDLGGQVQFLMVNVGELVDEATNFLSTTGYTFPVLFDVNGAAAYAYQISAIPATFFINAQGEIVNSHVGAMSQSDLLEAIAEIQN